MFPIICCSVKGTLWNFTTEQCFSSGCCFICTPCTAYRGKTPWSANAPAKTIPASEQTRMETRQDLKTQNTRKNNNTKYLLCKCFTRQEAHTSVRPQSYAVTLLAEAVSRDAAVIFWKVPPWTALMVDEPLSPPPRI